MDSISISRMLELASDMGDTYLKNPTPVGMLYILTTYFSQGFKPNGLLSVENFQELDQDIGKSAFKFRKVLNCFKQARDALYYPSKFPLESYLGQFIDVDKFLIDRYSDYSDKHYTSSRK